MYESCLLTEVVLTGYLDLVEYLVKIGLSVNLMDKNNENFDDAFTTIYVNRETAQYLYPSPLFSVCERRYTDFVRFLMQMLFERISILHH